jgi:hypothetical protein
MQSQADNTDQNGDAVSLARAFAFLPRCLKRWLGAQMNLQFQILTGGLCERPRGKQVVSRERIKERRHNGADRPRSKGPRVEVTISTSRLPLRQTIRAKAKAVNTIDASSFLKPVRCITFL